MNLRAATAKASLSPAADAASTFLAKVLRRVLTWRLRRERVSVLRMYLSADFVLAIADKELRGGKVRVPH